jgi:hypothetical protein
MSALGHKQTLGELMFYVRYAPESGHASVCLWMAAKCHEQNLTHASALHPAVSDEDVFFVEICQLGWRELEQFCQNGLVVFT